jgi:hypothetical protein
MFNIYTYKKFGDKKSISRIGFPHSSNNDGCYYLSKRLCNPNECDHPSEKVPDIIGMNTTPIVSWDQYTQEYTKSKKNVIIGITKDYTFFVGIFLETDLSKTYSYEAVYDNSVYFSKFYDVSELIVSKSGDIKNFIFEIKDDDDDSFSYSWVACFNEILLFFRIDKKFLDCVRYSEAEEYEISQWFKSKKPWYRINHLCILSYTRDIFFSNLYFRRFANSFSIELNSKDDKLTIDCELNPDGRSVKNSIKILKRQSNGDPDDEFIENSYEGIRFEEEEEKEPESDDSEEEESDADSDDSNLSGSMHLKQIVLKGHVCSTYESTESPKTEEFSIFENFMNFMKILLD